MDIQRFHHTKTPIQLPQSLKDVFITDGIIKEYFYEIDYNI